MFSAFSICVTRKTYICLMVLTGILSALYSIWLELLPWLFYFKGILMQRLLLRVNPLVNCELRTCTSLFWAWELHRAFSNLAYCVLRTLVCIITLKQFSNIGEYLLNNLTVINTICNYIFIQISYAFVIRTIHTIYVCTF